MILDTGAVSALLVGDPALGAVLAADQRHQLPVIVIGEYRYGLLDSPHREHLQQLLATLVLESDVLPIDEATVEEYARVRDELRRKGRVIPENDIWIAALARQHRRPLVSRCGHFDDVSELRRLNW